MDTLLDPKQALELVLGRVSPLASEQVPLGRALGRTLAAAVESSEPVPGFDNSAMDGFAVDATDTKGASRQSPARLELVGESRAGRPAPLGIRGGKAIRISTGAMLPEGADAVVRLEDCLEQDGVVQIETEVEAGSNVRRAGEDIQPGDELLGPGTLIGPAELGVLASVGATEVSCARVPRLAVLTTGDELVESGRPLGLGQIRNTNAYAVPAQARIAGAEVSTVETVPDDYEGTLRAIERGLGADVLIVCGGVSVGRHDYVKGAFAELEVERVFWGVALRPGHPTWFGVHGSTLVFGLPGNPVSAMVTFHLFARPALAALAGRQLEPPTVTAVMDTDYAKKPGRAHVVRCTLSLRPDGFHVRPTKEQGSHVLTSMLGASAFALLPVECGSVNAGEQVTIELLTEGSPTLRH